MLQSVGSQRVRHDLVINVNNSYDYQLRAWH